MTTDKTTEAVTAKNAGTDVLQCFWDLASKDEATRTSSGGKLVALIVRAESQHEGKDAENQNGNSDDVSSQSPLLQYCLKRLVNGLASSRENSRLGFGTALGALLNRSVTGPQVWRLMEENLTTSNRMKGEDARDAYIGRALCCSILVRSQCFLNEEGMTVPIVEEVVRIYNKKFFLRELCSSILKDLFDALPEERAQNAIQECQGLQEILTQEALDADPEALYLSLVLWGSCPESVLQKCSLLPKVEALPPKDWANGTDVDPALSAASRAFFSVKHLNRLVEVFKRSSQSHPKLHIVWGAVLKLLFPSYPQRQRSSSPVPVSSVRNFWSAIVLSGLLKSTEERQYLGHKLFRVLLPYFEAVHLPSILSRPFLVSVDALFKSKDSYLHSSATECIATLGQYIQRSLGQENLGPLRLMLRRLLKHGEFRELSKNALTELDSGELTAYLSQLMSGFSHAKNEFSTDDAVRYESDSEEDNADEMEVDGKNGSLIAGSSRDWVLDELVEVVKLEKLSSSDVVTVLRFMLVHGIYSVENCKGENLDTVLESAKQCDPEISQSIRNKCCSCILNMLPSLEWAAKKDQFLSGKTFLSDLCEYMGDVEEQGGELCVELTDVQSQAISTLADLMAHLGPLLIETEKANLGKDDANAKLEVEKIESVLELCLTLYLYIKAAPESIDCNLVKELGTVVALVFGGEIQEVAEAESESESDQQDDGNDASKDAEMGEVAEKVEPMDAFVDVVLSMYSRSTNPLPPQYLHNMVKFAFCKLCGDMKLAGWLDMLNVLGKGYSGDGEMFDLSGESEDELDEIDDGDNDSESELEEITEENEQGDDKSGSESDMDDNAMFKMDASIAAVLRAREDQKNLSEKRKSDVLAFNVRVVGLISHFLKKCPKHALSVCALFPLACLYVKLEGKSESQSLSEVVLRAFHSALKCRPVLTEEAGEKLQEYGKGSIVLAGRAGLGEEGRKVAKQNLKSLIRFLWGSQVSGHKEAAVKLLGEVVEKYFKSSKPLLQQIAMDLFLEVKPLAWQLLGSFPEYVLNVKTEFLKVQALGMMNTCLCERNVQPEFSHKVLGLGEAFQKVATYIISRPFKKKEHNAEALQELCRCVKNIDRILAGKGKAAAKKLIGNETRLQEIDEALKGDIPGKVQGKLKSLQQALSETVAPKTGQMQKKSDKAGKSGKKRKQDSKGSNAGKKSGKKKTG